MKIALLNGSISISENVSCREKLTSGYRNLASGLTVKKILCYQEAYETELDVAIHALDYNTSKALLDRGGFSKLWKKNVYLPLESSSDLTNSKFLSQFLKLKFDAVLLANRIERKIFEYLFDIPVFVLEPPAAIDRYQHLKKIKKLNECVVNLKNFDKVGVYPAASAAVVKKLKIPCYVALNPCYTRYTETLQEFIKYFNITNLTIIPSTHQDKYLEAVAKCKLFLTMDYRLGLGRFVHDAYAVGSVAVGVISDAMERLYPETCVKNHFDIDRVLELCADVLDDHIIYQYGRDKIYDYKNFEKNIKIIFSEYDQSYQGQFK